MPPPRVSLTPGTRRVLSAGGLTLGVLGIVFVADRLRTHVDEADTGSFGAREWSALAALCGASAAACVLLGVAWWVLLAQADVRVARPWAVRTYGVTQLAKYVPGNVMQFVGRQGVAVGHGLPGRAVAKSTAYEMACLFTAGALFGLLLLPRATALPEAAAVVVFALGASLALYLARRRLGVPIAQAFALHLTFLAIMGAVFVCVLELVADSVGDRPTPAYLVGAYVSAWLVGLLTPGAPAGLGIRESILFGLLHGMNSGDVAQTVVLARMVNVVGDALFFLAAWTMPKGAVAA